MMSSQLARIPSVDEILRTEIAAGAVSEFGRPIVVAHIRKQLEAIRDDVRKGVTNPPEMSEVLTTLLKDLEADNRSTVRSVLNLTGVIIHTNLGRAILPETAVDAAVSAMRTPVALEFNIETGGRGDRDDHIRSLLCELTGAEDAIAVNNNAAAVFLLLSALAHSKETIVSRGELIEIGGSFRIPSIMETAGTVLREVGTTNRTHPADYERAIGPQTALLMKIHKSNYAIEGFTTEVAPKELARIAAKAKLPFVDDLGSGTLIDVTPFGLTYERTVKDALRDGADIVTFSGDKLLGGPQAGFIVGRKDLVRQCAMHPLKRAVRLDKIRLAALEATLRLYRNPAQLSQALPTIRHMSRPLSEIRERALSLLPDLAKWAGPDWRVEVTDCTSRVGSGSLPTETLPSAGLAVFPDSAADGDLDALATRLRQLPTPVIGRVAGGRVVLDLRCLDDPQDLRSALSTP